MLNQPFENFSLVAEISFVNDRNPVPEIDQWWKFVEWEIGGQIRVENPDKTDLENICFAVQLKNHKKKPSPSQVLNLQLTTASFIKYIATLSYS